MPVARPCGVHSGPYHTVQGVNATFLPGPFRNEECLPGTCLPEDFCEAPSLWKSHLSTGPPRGSTYYITT
eukprot:gene5081-5182_t